MPSHRDARAARSRRPGPAPGERPSGPTRLGPDDLAALRALVEPAVQEAGLVLDDLSVAPAGGRRVVRLMVDLPDDAVGSLPLDDVAVASRAVDAALEAGGDAVLGTTPYVLEVGTPGTSRPLTQRRHWARARTRLVRVAVAGEEVTGRLVAVDDDGVVLVDPLDAAGARREVPWSALGTGRLELEFSHADAEEDAAAEGGGDDEDEED